MRGHWRIGGLVVVVAGMLPVLTGAAPELGDMAQNTRLLQKWKNSDPVHYARLQEDLLAFHALPADQQEQLRKFDRDLQNLDAKEKRRLWAVLERYGAWMDKLSVDQRREIESAGDNHEKLRMIRRVREGQWLDQFPQRVRDERRDILRKLPDDQHESHIVRWRQEDVQRRKGIKDQIKAMRPREPGEDDEPDKK